MTLQHFVRTMVVAGFGVAALGLISVAKAEGGEGASVIPPEAVAAVTQATVAEPEETASTAAGPAKAAVANLSFKSRTSDVLRASALRPLIARYALQHDVPYELADAVVRIESRYNAAARNGPNLGLTQVNFRTAQSLGYTGNAAGLFDAETNLRYGLKYLAQAYKLAGGNLCGAILRYQAGHRAQTMTNASRIYCSKVKTILAEAD
ncbi:lytic transglycosylase domain-containing protein [Microvirga brassicacearum]|uniref:Lytic transglycosylase domain-containing protein n=1 Tax=Microvirga brassicacearum TaxID=2580413 RepID=A0A5N3PBA6_9HYPH|nr:transglycosylase SLT domain-containing protein [Microvirga brassicacearum]KAB0267036.1 lytic transglycosylase domain-containing protein [Microvirga brassicacearum]